MMKIGDRPEKMNRRELRRREERRSACCCCCCTSPRSSNRARTQSPLRGGLEPGCRASWPTPILLSASNASGIVSAGDSGADERRLVCEKMAKKGSSVELAEQKKWEYTHTRHRLSLSMFFSTLAQLPFLPAHRTIRYRTYLSRYVSL